MFSIQSYAFGSEKWKEHFEVEVEETTAESLPENIGKTLSHICSALPNARIEKDLMLVWMPKGITINKMGELMKKKFPETFSDCRYFWYDVTEDIRNIENTKSHWVVMTTDVLPESRNKNYNEQQQLVAAFVKKTQMPFVVPDVLSAITCIFAKYVSSGTRPFSDHPWTYTRCQEVVGGWQVVVGRMVIGGDISTNLQVDYCSSYGFDNVGVAALRKF